MISKLKKIPRKLMYIYYYRIYEWILEVRGGLSLYWAKIFWGICIGKNVKARGKLDIVTDWGSQIILENDACLNSDSHWCLASSIYSPCKLRTFYNTAKIIIGNNVTVNGSSIVARSKTIKIGKGTNIAPNCMIMDTDFHDPWPSEGRFKRTGIENDQDVIIGENVWIGSRSIILKGAHIGDNSVIAAGSVVSGAIPSGVLAGGIPAKVIRVYEKSIDE